MSIYNDNIARPYVYLITYNDTGEYYFGYREANKKPATMDIGIKYFTSSDKIRERGLENTTIEIINEFEGPTAGDDAFDSEQGLIWHYFGNPLCLNGRVKAPGKGMRWKSKKGGTSRSKGKTLEEIYGIEKATKMKRHMHDIMKDKPFSEEHKNHMKKPKSEQGRKNMSDAALLRNMGGENNPFFGCHHTDEIKKFLRDIHTGLNNSMSDRNIYNWWHPIYGNEICNKYDLVQKYPKDNLILDGLSKLIKGRQITHRDWILKKIETEILI